MVEEIKAFLDTVPPLLQMVIGGIISIGFLYLVIRVADWNEGRNEDKKK